MKAVSLRTADDSADLNPYVGMMGVNGMLSQSGILKNTGDEPITSIMLKVENTPLLPANLTASVNGKLLNEATLTEVLSNPLAPGASVPVLLTWRSGAEALTGEDSATISGTVS